MTSLKRNHLQKVLKNTIYLMLQQVLEMTSYNSQTCLTPVKHDIVNSLSLSRNC